MAGAAQQIHRRPRGQSGGALPARARLIESIEVDGRLVHTYDADFLSREPIPFHGATPIASRPRLGTDGRLRRDGYHIDKQRGFQSPPPPPAAVKKFLREFKASLDDETRLGLRFHVMHERGRSASEIRAVLGDVSLDEARHLASEAVSRVIATLYRKFGCVPRHWVSWIGRV